MTPEYYLQFMTMHATIMVFFVLTTAPFAAFGNYFLPIQIGAEDMPFPHFNMMSFWVTFVGFLRPDHRVFRERWPAARRMDRLRSTERDRKGGRPWTRHGPSNLGRLLLPSSASASCWGR